MCGTAEWEWSENKRAYHPVNRFCPGCYLKAKQAENNDSLDGTTVELVPNTPELQEKLRLDDIRTMESERARKREEAEAALEDEED